MTQNFLVYLASLLCLTLGIACSAAQQDKASRPSPPAQATCQLTSGATITIDYSSPRAKGRKIFGGIVPFGKIWRAGANEATSFVTTADLSVGGTTVPAGTYTIFAIPEQNQWTLVISKKTGEWGLAYAGAGEDLARIGMKVSQLPSSVENFTIAFDHGSSSCTLDMDWETTRASVDISKK
jgi:hypothetical protein